MARIRVVPALLAKGLNFWYSLPTILKNAKEFYAASVFHLYLSFLLPNILMLNGLYERCQNFSDCNGL